ncbi:MAG: acyl-CoA dehydrogenase [Alphaproteobacteria bacterium]|nr:acyl-CoA dehydrogenase [Alphaproteobacteria bacterium]
MALDAETRAEFLATIRRFVRERCVPAEKQVSETDAIPPAIVAEMKRLGLFGISIPTEYGGVGLGMEDEALTCFELGWTSPAFRSVAGTNIGIGSQGLVMDGTEAQKRAWLPRIASGEIVTSFALTEPEAGSDAASLRTRARREGDHYVLDGTKRFITNSPQAGLFTVMARSDPANKGAGGITAFLVETGTKGLSIGKPNKKMGQQGAHTADVVFEDCRVPAANVLGGVEGKGFYTAMKVLDRGRLHISAICIGLAERLLHEAASYAAGRKQFGQPIAGFQLIQAMLADCRTEILAARSMVLETARRRDRGEDVATDAACCKYFASEMVGRVADRAVQIHGGAGYMADYAVERFYRDARLFRIYEGTSQIQQIVIARGVLKELGA